MKLSGILSILLLLTIVSLLYVHQSLEAVKCSYAINSKKSKVSSLLDRNDLLQYNIYALSSPMVLENALGEEDIFGLPSVGQFAKLELSPESNGVSSIDDSVTLFAHRQGYWDGFFSSLKEAEAGVRVQGRGYRVEKNPESLILDP